jgi:hypothetical protein
MRWVFVPLLLSAGISCSATSRPTPSNPASAILSKRSIRQPALDPDPSLAPARSSQPPSESLEPPHRRSSRINAGACLEPLEPVYLLGADWTALRRGFNLEQDALVILAIVPAFQPHALSLHRDPGGAYFLRVTHLNSGGLAPSVRDGTIDSRTARVLLDLWSALISRVQMLESDDGSFDGKAYYFSAGQVTGYAANPHNDSVLDRTIFALNWLGRLVEEHGREDPTDRQFIREELEEALARTRAREPCVRVVSE